MKQIVLVVVFLALMIQGCQKQQLPHYTINPGLMSAWGFKTGTYWIYQDSLSGEVDSFVVVNTRFITNTQSMAIYDEYDVYISTFNSDSFKFNYRMAIGDSGVSFINESISNEMEFNLDYAVFTYPIYSGQSYIITVNDSTYVSEIFASLLINNGLYKNVAQIHHYSSVDQGNVVLYQGIMKHNDWFYACDKVGFVKIVFNHPDDSVYRNWELLRYHIEK